MKKLLTLTALTLILGTSFAVAGSHDKKGSGHSHEARFAEQDLNGDGTINKVEFMKAAEKRAAKHFRKIDTNNDGKISKREAKAAQKHMMKKKKESFQYNS